MKKLRVKFVDFWIDMNQPEGNYFYELLSEKFEVEFSNNPDILFYSCFGNEYLKYTCTRIFYSPENWRPNFSQCDYAITFDYLNDKRHLRLPLWVLYYITYERTGIVQQFTQTDAVRKFEDWKMRENFCCIIVSNENAKERINFYHRLNARLKVDSAGKWNNTIGKPLDIGTENKFEFIKNYRFVISFENSSHSGYTTEKILEPLLAGCIPIYWGDPDISIDFNSHRFIQVRNSEDYDKVIDRILEIENHKETAKDILDQPMFNSDGSARVYLEKDYALKRIFNWIEEAESRKFKGTGSAFAERVRYYLTLSKSRLKAIKPG